MIVVCCQELIGVLGRDAMYQNIVYSLQVERFLYLGVWRDNEVQQNEGRDEKVERPRRESHVISRYWQGFAATSLKVGDWNCVDATYDRRMTFKAWA
jgi:hypothetical protein